MATSPFHDEAGLGEIHRPHNWEYASAAARKAAGGFAILDQNKIALQLDDYSYWILTDFSTASWRRVASAIFDNRGGHDATSDLFPSSGGSGGGGAIEADNIWYITGAGTLGGTPVVVGDAIRALVDAPAQVAANWLIYPVNVDTVGEETIIKDSDNGVVGKTAGKINFMNIARDFISFFRNLNTAARTYDFQDADGTIPLNNTAEVILSATTTDMSTTKQDHINISGVITIAGFGTMAAGVIKYGKFLGILTITNSAAIATIHGVDVVTKAGDRYKILSLGSGNWEFLYYRRKGGDIPVGTEINYMGTGLAEDGYLLEDGANVSRTTYADLFAKISTLWGAGDGSTTFGLPDSRRRTSVGAGGSSSIFLGNAVGNTDGEEGHIMTGTESAPHTHTIDSYTLGGGVQRNRSVSFGAFTGNLPTSSSGSGALHNNIQPSMVVTKQIKF